ncbi:D5 protein [Salmonella phage SP-3]|uniref:D5 protein n=1 Tax=Salmonella phage SP-3 TaxID=1186124 RepID=A0A2H4PIQ0_9CAUD|nr:HNH endonuclease [Salmonella phage SP3]ATW62682.1 D5 protein [Salmonella phage SP3]
MANHKPLLPLAEYQKKFDYDPETGIFTWNSGSRKGKPAGSKEKDGLTLYMGKLGRFKAHRVAWLYVTGEDPGEFLIDHRDQDPFNNRWNNLRKATNAENGKNSSGWKNESTGVKGVTLTSSGKYRARIRVDGNMVNIGTFESLEEAVSNLNIAREILHGEFANAS